MSDWWADLKRKTNRQGLKPGWSLRCLVCETWLCGSTPPSRPARFAQQLLSRPESQNPLTAVHLVHLDGQTSRFHAPGQHLLNAICLFIYCCKGACNRKKKPKRSNLYGHGAPKLPLSVRRWSTGGLESIS